MQEFINIFAEMGWASAILLIFGALLLIAEALTPGFNVAGISGLICLVLGIVARVVEGATLTQTLLLILLVTIIVCVLFVLFVRSAKSGMISKTSIIETGTAIPKEYGEIRNKELLGKIGVTKTLCKPVGKVVIGDRIFDAITSYGYIEADEQVIVEKVDHDYLYIKQLDKAVEESTGEEIKKPKTANKGKTKKTTAKNTENTEVDTINNDIETAENAENIKDEN